MLAKNEQDNNVLMTFGGHLNVFRQMLFRILAVVSVLTVLTFCFQKQTWQFLLGPSKSDFVLYRILQRLIDEAGINVKVDGFHIDMMSTDLTSQFMTHVSTSTYLGLFLSSPYIMYEIYRFISPALYNHEKRSGFFILMAIYVLFFVGMAINYFVMFPLSFRFLGTYQVDPSIKIQITLDSYISSFLTLSFVMGLVFQLPVIFFFLARFGLVGSDVLIKYRRHAIVLIVLLSAIITPPDIFSCIVVSIPLYALYELSILIVKYVEYKYLRQ